MMIATAFPDDEIVDIAERLMSLKLYELVALRTYLREKYGIELSITLPLVIK